MSNRISAISLAFILLLWLFLVSLAENASGAEWLTLHNCHYLPNPANDGDSFHVRAGSNEYIFRLYFVDAPETDASIRDRLRDQARYFRVTTAQALQIGREAECFTRQELSRPFTVRTCLEDARGRSHLPRYFALVEVAGADLAERLVANGLARVFGAGSETPGMKRPQLEWQKLRQLERQAKRERIGGWGVAFGRVSVRAAAQPGPNSGYSNTNFHARYPSAASKIPLSSGKLDINTATTEQLEGVPGLGRILAHRIIEARPFRSADDLQRVEGIGAKKYEKVRRYFK
jgi:endonuclease YncB( thermonuclease family)